MPRLICCQDAEIIRVTFFYGMIIQVPLHDRTSWMNKPVYLPRDQGEACNLPTSAMILRWSIHYVLYIVI
jgi:hypothetical protein